jgi:hypothetical protein
MVRWLDRLTARLRSLFRRGRVEAELDRELRFHLAQQMAENLDAGMKPEDARASAARSVGSGASLRDRNVNSAALLARCDGCRRVNRVDSAVDLPRPVGLSLKDAHQLAAGTDRRARARTHAVAVRPPFEGMVAENLDLLNVEHIVNYFRTLDSPERFLDDAAAALYGPGRRKQHDVVRPL